MPGSIITYSQVTTKARLSGAAHMGVSSDFKHLPGSIDHGFFLWPLRWWTESPPLLFPVLVTVAKQRARINERKGFNQGVAWGCAFCPGREGMVQGQEAASHSAFAARKLSVRKKGGQTIRSQGPPPSVTHFPDSEGSTILPNNTTCWGPIFKHAGLWGTSLPSEDFARVWRKNVVD